jgi:hypothetical protein
MLEKKNLQIESMENENQEITIYTPGTNDKLLTTVKAYQTIYDQITGRRQRIQKEFRINYEIGFGHLDQLNIKINQLLRQYHVISKNCLIDVMHEDDDEEVFESYEKFSTYNISNNHPITVINIRYNFSILYPGEKEITNYSLNISITPGNILPTNLRERYGRLRYYGPTIRISVNYSDYIIARTFVDNVTEWIKGVEIIDPHNKLKSFIIKNIDNLSALFEVFLMGFIIFIIFYNNKKIVPPRVQS